MQKQLSGDKRFIKKLETQNAIYGTPEMVRERRQGDFEKVWNLCINTKCESKRQGALLKMQMYCTEVCADNRKSDGKKMKIHTFRYKIMVSDQKENIYNIPI